MVGSAFVVHLYFSGLQPRHHCGKVLGDGAYVELKSLGKYIDSSPLTMKSRDELVANS